VDLGFQEGANKAFTYMAKKSDNQIQLVVEHALSRGVWGHAPTGKLCKFGLRLNLVVILSEIISPALFIPLFRHSLSI